MRLDRISAHRVSKVFDRQRAVYDVDLEVREGEVLGLLGPNGAGKTTLLGLLSSLSRPTRGVVQWWAAGRQLSVREVRAQLSWVAHQTFTYDELTGRENLELFARLQGVSDAPSEARSWLVRLDLEFAAERPAKTYSRGMRQRLALGRSLVGRPRALLLDEPFSGLDASSTRQVMEVLHACKADGTAMVLVSHDVSQAAELSDRFLLLRNGRVRVRIDEAQDAGTLRDQLTEVTEARAQ